MQGGNSNMRSGMCFTGTSARGKNVADGLSEPGERGFAPRLATSDGGPGALRYVVLEEIRTHIVATSPIIGDGAAGRQVFQTK